jgi:DnaJ like chaperone protein
MIIGKLVAGGLGLIVAGIPGVIFGLVLGHFFDSGLASAMRIGAAPAPVVKEAFFRCSFLLMGHIAKADGRVSEEEIAHTEAIFRQLGLDDAQRLQAIVVFKEGTAAGFSVEACLREFLERTGGNHALNQALLNFLIAMALADHELHAAEREVLLRIGPLLGFPAAAVARVLDMATAQAHFHRQEGGRAGTAASAPSLADAYAALGVQESASDAELKRAYRRLMSQHHPDKLSARGVPEEVLRVATEKSQEIQAAYELIRKSRGLR